MTSDFLSIGFLGRPFLAPIIYINETNVLSKELLK